MKKKVLFIVGTLQSGGVSKSMVSLLSAWDKKKYDTSLLVCCMNGDIYSKILPQNIKIIYNPIIEHVMGGVHSALWLLRHKYFILSLCVLLRLALSQFSKSLSGKLIAKMMPIIGNEVYDLIVDYGGQQLLYYMVDKLHAKKKVSFFHSDYSKWGYYYKADKKYFPKVDQIFTISKTCAESLKKYFPNCRNKISIMENILSPKLINKLSFEENFQTQKHELTLVTVGHILYNKGIDFAIDAAEVLKKQKIDFIWIFVGKIIEKKWIEEIKQRNLFDKIKFVGIQTNPYPYIRNADIYVQPSRYEGKSIALDEAKILCKPIVVTNFSTVNDQFENGKNATICNMDGTSLADAIIHFYNSPKLQQNYIDYLKTHIHDNSSEVQKLYKFL